MDESPDDGAEPYIVLAFAIRGISAQEAMAIYKFQINADGYICFNKVQKKANSKDDVIAEDGAKFRVWNKDYSSYDAARAAGSQYAQTLTQDGNKPVISGELHNGKYRVEQVSAGKQKDVARLEVHIGSLLDDYADECFYIRFNKGNGKTSITFTRDNGSDYLITLPKYMYCGLLTEVTIEHDEETAFVKEPDLSKEYIMTGLSCNIDHKSWEFYCGNEIIFEIEGKGWMFDMEQGKEKEEERDGI